MSFEDVIADLSTGTYTVTRHLTANATIVDGIYTPDPTPTTFQIVAAVQPARGLPRVTGGRDMISDEQNQHVNEALVMWTVTEVRERTPLNDPDTMVYNGRTYTIARTEYWPPVFDEDGYYVAVLVLQTQGAS
jgi:hypothetical protein